MGQACICFFDPEEQYYRAKIVLLKPAFKKAAVLYVDYGNIREVPYAYLRQAVAEYWSQPIFAQRAVLDGVSPRQRNPDEVWKDEHLAVMHQVMIDDFTFACGKNFSVFSSHSS